MKQLKHDDRSTWPEGAAALKNARGVTVPDRFVAAVFDLYENAWRPPGGIIMHGVFWLSFTDLPNPPEYSHE